VVGEGEPEKGGVTESVQSYRGWEKTVCENVRNRLGAVKREALLPVPQEIRALYLVVTAVCYGRQNGSGSKGSGGGQKCKNVES